MIFAKITPATSGSYIVAEQTSTVVDAENNTFRIHQGDIEFNKSGSVKTFTEQTMTLVNITGSALTTWDTDKVAFLNAVATQLGAKVESTVEGTPRNY